MTSFTNHGGPFVILLSLAAAGILHAQTPAPRWPHEHQIGQFEVHSDFDVEADRSLVAQLGSLRRDISETLQITIQPEPIHLLLFDQHATYESYLNRYFPGVPARRAMFIKRRGPGMVFAYRSRELSIDLRHETTHALLNASLPYVPLWLDEGMAEYFEGLPQEGQRTNKAHLPSVRRRAFWGSVRSVDSLEAIEDLSNMGTREYQDAWSWVHFLLHESDSSKAILLKFLADLQAHSPPGQLSRRIAIEMPDWKQALLAIFPRITGISWAFHLLESPVRLRKNASEHLKCFE